METIGVPSKNVSHNDRNGALAPANGQPASGVVRCPAKSLWRASVLALVSAFCGVSAAQYGQRGLSDDATNDVPRNVRDQLRKAATAMSAAHLVFRRAQAGQVPPSYGGPSSYSVYFDSGRFYQRRQDVCRHDNGEVERVKHEDAFDGAVFFFGEPEIPTGDVPAGLVKFAIDDNTDPERHARLISIPYLSAAGFYFPSSVAELTSPSVESLVLHSVAKSTSTRVERAGKNLRITVEVPDPLLLAMQHVDLKKEQAIWQGGRNSPEAIARQIAALKKMKAMVPKRTVAFVLDPNRRWGVVRREEWTAAGERIVDVTTDEWTYHETGGIWLPKRCVESYYTYPSGFTVFADQPMLTFTLELERVEFGPQKNITFALNYKKPGALVRDRTSREARESPDHEVLYMVSADGVTLRRSAEKALLEMDRGRPAITWIYVNGALMALLVIGFLIRRARRGCGC